MALDRAGVPASRDCRGRGCIATFGIEPTHAVTSGEYVIVRFDDAYGLGN
jgi:hypothetical protein